MTNNRPERVELRLDNRQLFFLFVGCAVVCGLSFALGVAAGRRMAPAQPARSAPALADLDATRSDEDLTFPEALSKPKPVTPLAKLATAEIAIPKPEPKPAPAKPAPKLAAPARELVALPEGESYAPGKRKKAKEPVLASAAPVAEDEERTASFGGSHDDGYTIQISSHPTRSEAESVAAKYRRYGASIREAKIEGRGTWYRVHLGHFAERDAAQRFLSAFTSAEGKSAIIIKETR